MAIKETKATIGWREVLRQAGIAVILPALAGTLQWLLWGYLKPLAFFVFYPTIFICALLAGFVGGVVATLFSAAIAWYVFLPPEFSFELATPQVLHSILGFLFTGCLFSYFCRNVINASNAKARELSLKESLAEREKFEFLANSSADFISMCDMNFVPFYVNPAAMKLVGLGSQEEVLKTSVKEFFFPEDQKFILEEFFPKVVKEGTGQVEVRFRHFKTGNPIWMLYQVQYIRSKEGKAVGLATISRDITERKANEEKVQQANRDLETILEAMPNMLFVKDAKELKFARLNKAGEELLGYSRNDLMGKSDFDFFPKSQAESFIAKDHEVLAGGKTVLIQEEPIKTKYKGERILRTRKVPVWDRAGKPLYLLGVSEDITEQKEVERKLRENEARFRNLVTDVKDYAIFMLDPNGIIQTWNRGAEILKGYQAKEVLGKNFSLFYTKEDVQKKFTEHELKTAFSKGVYEARAIRVRKDGTTFIAHVVITAIFDENGQHLGYSKVVHDVTVEETSKKAALDSEKRFRTLFEDNPEALFIIELENGKISECNSAFLKILRATREQVIGLTQDVLSPEIQPDGTPSSPEVVKEKIETTLRNGVNRFEWTHRRFNGELFPCDVNVVPIDYEGRKVLLVGWRDMTKFKEAQEKLREKDLRFQASFENQTNGQMTISKNGKILIVNETAIKLFGYPKEKLIGMSVDDLVPDSVKHRHADLRNSYLREPTVRSLGKGRVLMGRRADGLLIPVEVSLSPIQFNNSLEILVTLVDSTLRVEQDRKINESVSELKRSNEELENFAYIASHDLQSPLRHIASYTDLLVDKIQPAPGSEVEKWGKYISTATVTMKSLVDGLLQYSRVKANQLEFTEIDLNAMLQKIVLINSSTYPDANIECGTLPQIKGVENLIYQLFQNLIQNACKYRKAGTAPVVRVEARKINGVIAFSVSDNGIGIAKEHYERVFQLFQRLHTKEKYEGTGLGLAICKKIVQLHSGKIWIESTPNVGTAFFFTLPPGG